MKRTENLLRLIEREPLSSSDIRARLGVSQPTLSRLVRAAGSRVVRIGKGRATRYARAAPVFEMAHSVPLFAIDDHGQPSELASVNGVWSGSYYLTAHDAPFWLLGERGDGLFESLPYFLYDLRPAGFMGRQLARRLAVDWGFPPDPRDWTDTQIGQYLVRRGDDVPGHLVVGEAAAQRVNQGQIAPIANRESAYPELAARALREEEPGSSAAGEQPKFTAYCAAEGHVIVKFSATDAGPEAERGRDLLRAEWHALRCIQRCSRAAADSAIYQFGNRVFLESRRFDRVGPRGRAPAISLRMADMGFGGDPRSWTGAARQLHQRGLLGAECFDEIVWLATFGAWIGNTDMHLGNIALRPRGRRFELLPAYDMLPMAYAPRGGDLLEVTLRPPLRTTLNAEVWDATRAVAATFWSSLADDRNLSDPFRTISAANALALE